MSDAIVGVGGVREAAELIRAWPCVQPGCDGNGYPVQVAHGGWEQVQCQFCDERKRVLAILAALPADTAPVAGVRERLESLHEDVQVAINHAPPGQQAFPKLMEKQLRAILADGGESKEVG